MLTYPVLLTRDTNGTLLVAFPDWPEAHTFGRDEAEALRRGRDCLATVIGARIRDRRPIPAPFSGAAVGLRVSLTPIHTLKVELYRAMLELGVRKADLARRLDVHQAQVDRLLDLRHASRFDQLESALAAVGKQVDVQVGDRILPPSHPPRARRTVAKPPRRARAKPSRAA